MAGFNLNELFNRLTNFKIKFTEKPSPVQVSNADLFFFVGSKRVEFNTIMYDETEGVVIIEFEDI